MNGQKSAISCDSCQSRNVVVVGQIEQSEQLSDQSVSQACEYFSIQGIGKQHKNKTKPRISLDTKTQRRTKKGKKLCIFIITRQRDDHHQTNYHHQCRKSAAINELLTVHQHRTNCSYNNNNSLAHIYTLRMSVFTYNASLGIHLTESTTQCLRKPTAQPCPALKIMMEYYLHRTPFSWPIDCVHRNRLVQ